MLTFSTPCLRWKLLAAGKLQYGWPGFVPPYRTRYLHMHVVTTTQPNDGNSPSQAAKEIRVLDLFMDRQTGAITQSGTYRWDYNFPYGETLTENPIHIETWDVSETHFLHSYNNSAFQITIEVTLSNPYTLAQLNADVDAILDGIAVDTIPWNTAFSAGGYALLSDANNAIPAQWSYAGYLRVASAVTVPLQAAAYSAWTPGLVGAIEQFPNECVKVVGWIAMAGHYCLDTVTIDPAMNLLDQICQSGVGGCATPFEVLPPPISDTSNAYVVFTPNCQCGG